MPRRRARSSPRPAHRAGPAKRPKTTRRGRNRTSRPRAPATAADMLDLALLVHRGDRLGAQIFAARRMHRIQRHRRIDLRQHRAHHVAALVDLGDQRVGLEPPVQRDRLRGPAGGDRPAARRILEHIDAAVLGRPAATMPQASAPGRDGAGGSIADHDARERRRRRDARTPRSARASTMHPARSSMISPSISCRPSRVPA